MVCWDIFRVIGSKVEVTAAAKREIPNSGSDNGVQFLMIMLRFEEEFVACHRLLVVSASEKSQSRDDRQTSRYIPGTQRNIWS